MAFLSPQELLDIVVMSLVVGYIFKDVFRPAQRLLYPEDFLKNVTPGFRKPRVSDFWFAVLLVAPAIILHELGHKFVAIAFGFQATFEAAYVWLALGILMKLFFPGFIFFIPAVTMIIGGVTPLSDALISVAGPAVNGLLWLGCVIYLKTHRKAKAESLRYIVLFRRINGILFIFNMIPIPGFDGFSFFSSVYRMFI
jgi:Zn-dependent protease